MPVLYLYSIFLFPFFYTFLYSWYILHIPSLFFIFLVYFLYSFHIFYIPAIFFIFLLYFLYSFYIFYIPSIFFIFVLISIQHVTDMDHDAPVLHFPPFWFKKKMIDGNVLRDGNERGLYNFVESLRSLLFGIQNLNEQEVSVDYFEEANLRLEDAISTL